MGLACRVSSPGKLFEYLAVGLPTIGPDTPAVREVFEDGVHLRLASQDGSDLAWIIEAMKADPAARDQLAQAGRRLVVNEYTWEKNAERVVMTRLDEFFLVRRDLWNRTGQRRVLFTVLLRVCHGRDNCNRIAPVGAIRLKPLSHNQRHTLHREMVHGWLSLTLFA